MVDMDYTTAKLCAECGGGAAKFIRTDENGKPVQFFCGKHMGTHRRLASSYRSDKWTTEHHQAVIKGAFEMTEVQKAESLLNFTKLKKERDEANCAAADNRRAEKERREILSQPAWLRERVKNYHCDQGNADLIRKVEVLSDSYGVEIELMNWMRIKSRRHAEDLISQINSVLHELDEETVKWEDDMSNKIVAADEAKAALEAKEAVTADQD